MTTERIVIVLNNAAPPLLRMACAPMDYESKAYKGHGSLASALDCTVACIKMRQIPCPSSGPLGQAGTASAADANLSQNRPM